MLTICRKLGIMLWVLLIRLLKSILELLVWVDQGVGLILAIPFYIVLGHPRPNADETISSVVGYYAIEGRWWALVAEWVIDRIFYVFEGFRLGHCRRHVELDEIDWDEALLYDGATLEDFTKPE